MAILHALLRQYLFPGFLGVIEDEGDELFKGLLTLVFRPVGPRNAGAGPRGDSAAAEHGKEVAFEQQAQNEQEDNSADADMHAAEGQSETTASSAVVLVPPIFNVLTVAAWCPAHGCSFLANVVLLL